MFGKKKHTGIPVMHYEGIDSFATDYPVQIEVKDNIFEIRRLKPETTVTLPMDRITNQHLLPYNYKKRPQVLPTPRVTM